MFLELYGDETHQVRVCVQHGLRLHSRLPPPLSHHTGKYTYSSAKLSLKYTPKSTAPSLEKLLEHVHNAAAQFTGNSY